MRTQYSEGPVHSTSRLAPHFLVGSVVRRLVGVASVAGALVYGGAATAVTVWYAEVKTSTLLGNVHGEITSPTELGSVSDLASIDLDSLGTGLGSARVNGTPLDITHTFAPNGYSVNDVHSAVVAVSVVDDALFDSSESGQIVVDGSVLDGGSAMFNLFDGDVTALVAAIGDSITVRVQATRGDFQVLFSAVAVRFDGTAIRAPGPGIPATPEPSAALLFAVGVVAVRQGLRRSA
jgi:hypothetical protein